MLRSQECAAGARGFSLLLSYQFTKGIFFLVGCCKERSILS